MKIFEIIMPPAPPNIKAIAYKIQQELIDLDREVELSSVMHDGKLIAIRLDIEGDKKLKEKNVSVKHCIEIYDGPEVFLSPDERFWYSIDRHPVNKISYGVFLFSSWSGGRTKRLAPKGRTNFGTTYGQNLLSFINSLDEEDWSKLMKEYRTELW